LLSSRQNIEKLQHGQDINLDYYWLFANREATHASQESIDLFCAKYVRTFTEIVACWFNASLTGCHAPA